MKKDSIHGFLDPGGMHSTTGHIREGLGWFREQQDFIEVSPGRKGRGRVGTLSRLRFGWFGGCQALGYTWLSSACSWEAQGRGSLGLLWASLMQDVSAGVTTRWLVCVSQMRSQGWFAVSRN
ncbi:hypothetical protein HJG60_011353 [Phyllostomus discolor]|uniref:Uncharacterized protein n=1 Tax=Phyllostomus discolor TaxID=89673 RepID=A0A834E7S4_9CHIR|nr:hypothetical protein HJG60_011353 [Phyllostomus discolor]